MNTDKTKKIILIGTIIIIIALNFYYVILSKSVAEYNFRAGRPLQFYSFMESFKTLITNRKQQMTFLYFDVITILLLFFIVYNKIIGVEKYKSNEIEITPAIKIPAPAGQGQFGSKWFMKDKEKEKVFKVNVVDFNNPLIAELLKTGQDDLKGKIEKLDSGEASIVDIENIIKKERKQKKELEEKKEFEEIIKNEFDTFDISKEEKEWTKEEIEELTENEEDDYIENNEDEIKKQNELLYENIINEKREEEKENLKLEKPYSAKDDKYKLFKSGGLITGFYTEKGKEKIYYVDKDTHSVIIGATRSGKSRCLVMQSMYNTALAGESMVITDPKGELYAYTSEFMRKLGYEVICLDFKDAKTSSKYNLLQPIINAKNDRTPEHPNGDIETIVKFSEELANMLIKETKGENPMWTDNAKTMITGAILTLVLENDDEEVMNLTNVYRLINSGEGKDIDQKVDNLGLYIKALKRAKPESPIINAMLGVINTPSETRGGFSTNASSATRLFTQPSIYQITGKSNVDLTKMGERKQILYFILPDQDTSYYKIVSIIVKQMYNELVKVSDKFGGRLPIRVNFFLDEFGNFAPIPDIGAMLTVAGGRGMRFNLFIQGFPQITQKYDKETTEIVKSNCETWIYLKANDTETQKNISDKCGSYTIYSNSESMSIQNGNITSGSSSQSLQKRNLLLPEEVKSIDRPYLLVFFGNNDPAINIAPDISKLSANKVYGMGDEKHNNNLRVIRDRQRTPQATNEDAKYFELYSGIIIPYLNDAINPYKSLEGYQLDKPRTIGEEEYIINIVRLINNNYQNDYQTN